MQLWKILERCGFLLRTIGLILQVKEVKRTKSIYGLSFDYQTLSMVELLMSMLFSLLYTLSSVVHEQYARRFPVYPECTLDFVVTFSDTLSLILVSCLAVQCLKYRNTRHQFQYVSKGTLALLSISLLAMLFVFNSVNFKDSSHIGTHGLFLIDLVDSFWFIGNCAGMVKWAPQLTTNFIGMNGCQITREASWIELLSASLSIIGRLSRDKLKFYDFPVNEQAFSVLIGRLILASLNVYQIKLYQGRSKKLPAKFTTRHDQYEPFIELEPISK